LLLLEQGGGREALLATVGVQLSGLTEVAAVQAVVERAAKDLCVLTPGLALLIVSREGEQAVIEAAHGLPLVAVGRAVGSVTTSSWLVGLEPGGPNHGHRFQDAAPLDDLVGRRRSGWTGIGLGTLDTD
jgi:hypothetical protein